MIITACSNGGVTTTPSTTATTKGSSAGTTSTGGTSTEPGQLPLVTEETALTIGLPQHVLTTNYDDNYTTNYIESKTGISIEFYFFPTSGTEATQKLELMVGSNQELPDIVTGIGINNAAKVSYGNQGVILALNDYIDENTYYWKQAVDKWCSETEKENLIKYAKAYDGNIYAFPFYIADPGDAQSPSMWINKSWLTELNLEMPATTDDLYDVLVAFRDQDPNGNMKNDEIPLIGQTSWGRSWSVGNLLINAFTYFSPYFLNVENGVLSAPFVSDAYREGLRYAKKLVDEKLCSPLAFTQTLNELTAMLDIPKEELSTVGVFAGHPWVLFTNVNPHRSEYTCIPPLTGPKGVSYVPASVRMGSYNTFITKYAKDPLLAFKLLDFFCEEEASITLRFGEKESDWEYATEGESRYHALGFDPVINLIMQGGVDPWASENNILWHISNTTLIPIKLFGGLTWPDFINEDHEYFVKDWYESIALREGKNPPEVVGPMIYTEEETLDINEIETTIKTFIESSLTQFILGDLDIEKDWDKYVNDLKTIGLDHWLEVSQTCYDRMNK